MGVSNNNVHVLPSADISIHSWSSVYFFSLPTASSAPHPQIFQLLFCGKASGYSVRAADTENSRCLGLTCAHRWHAKGVGRLAAAQVNWRAARTTEVRAAILCVRLCVCVCVRLSVFWSEVCWSKLVGAICMPRSRWSSRTLMCDCGTVGRIRTLFATGDEKNCHHHQPPNMLYEMIGVVCTASLYVEVTHLLTSTTGPARPPLRSQRVILSPSTSAYTVAIASLKSNALLQNRENRWQDCAG